MKVLCTGGLGHIGSALIRSLPPEYEITVYDDLSSQRYCSLYNLPRHIQFVQGSILDAATVDHYIKHTDCVIHLAASTNASTSNENREEVMKVNHGGTFIVANACWLNDKYLLFPSTTSVYGPQGDVVDEFSTELNPQSAYAESKLKAEREIQDMEGLSYTILRLGTIVGPSIGMRWHTAVQQFVWNAMNGFPIRVWRDAQNQVRPYLSLDDAVGTICNVIHEERFRGELFNVATDNLTVNEVIRLIQHYVPVAVEIVNSPILNQHSYRVDTSKIRASNLYCHHTSIDLAIDKLVLLLEGLRDIPKV